MDLSLSFLAFAALAMTPAAALFARDISASREPAAPATAGRPRAAEVSPPRPCGADHQLAAELPSADYPLGIVRRPVRGLCSPRLPVHDPEAVLQLAGLKELISIVSDQTFRRRVREKEEAHTAEQATPKRKPGPPRTPDNIRELVLKRARENSRGYTRILGELRSGRVRVAALDGPLVV
ncbi:hypothetical protein [Maioricimonas sp. JC845]|uniref:hypothetical protein n=1 Tax=Maioricimonas sp. JC845 TaxID=3232138 RepID=UPI00345AF9C9